MAPSLRLHAGWRGASRRPPSADRDQGELRRGRPRSLPWLVDLITFNIGQASDPVDKEPILAQVRDPIGFKRFDEDVAAAVVPVVQVLSMHRCAMSAHLVARRVLQRLIQQRGDGDDTPGAERQRLAL